MPAKAAPKAGETYVLTNPEGYGTGLGSLPTGSKVTVAALHPAGTQGVGHGGTDAVVVAHEHDTHVITDTGDRAPGKTTRHFSLTPGDFLRLFKKVT